MSGFRIWSLVHAWSVLKHWHKTAVQIKRAQHAWGLHGPLPYRQLCRPPKNCKRRWTRAMPKSWRLLSTMRSCTKSVKRWEILTEKLPIDSAEFQLASSYQYLVLLLAGCDESSGEMHCAVLGSVHQKPFRSILWTIWWILSNLVAKACDVSMFEDARIFCRILEALQETAWDWAS